MMQSSALPAENTPGRAVVLGIGRAEALSAAGKSEDARGKYLSLLQQHPDYPGLHFAYGLFLMNVHEPEEAVTQLKTELQLNPNHVIALLQIAALRATEDPGEAVEYAKKAVALNPRLPFGHYLLGQFYLDAGNAAGAIPELERARHEMPNESKIYFALGNAYAKIGRKEEAAQARASFRRLQAQEKSEAAPSTYGQEPQGASPEKLVLPEEEKPRE
jgi:predicted Zn-dependent protease